MESLLYSWINQNRNYNGDYRYSTLQDSDSVLGFRFHGLRGLQFGLTRSAFRDPKFELLGALSMIRVCAGMFGSFRSGLEVVRLKTEAEALSPKFQHAEPCKPMEPPY